ncbi:hypothetical protein KGQ19_18195 [Catenulispora sp. NL8]|uniref:Uncharacterized protein n=1 Tax=Catenulispora pinistramenti TaxID=2705254 RepID=A0ABS5KS27_9ACTN|nr:hypothetical protein [Catenulispora pinistramenti]MBS2548800.1 hypothetical protein [Catenulispora pinistramenti]
MPSYLYHGEALRTYPAPPLARELSPGDVVDLDEDQVPDDGRFTPTPDPPPKPAKATTAKGADA